jgi:hypothetical protein
MAEQVAGGVLVDLAMHVTEKVLEKSRLINLVSRKFMRKTVLRIGLSFAELFKFYTLPKYDECLLKFHEILKEFRETKEIIRWNSLKYQLSLNIGQKVDIAAPISTFGVDRLLEPEEYLSESLFASSVRVHLTPLIPDEISIDTLEETFENAFDLLKHIEERSKATNLQIRNIVKFVRLAVQEDKGSKLIDCLRSSVSGVYDYTDSGVKTRLIILQIQDTSAIHALTSCLRRVL